MSDAAVNGDGEAFNFKMQLLFASVLQAVWIGFDSSYFVIYCHERFRDAIQLTVAVTLINLGVFVGTVSCALIKKRLNAWLYLLLVSSIRVALESAISFIEYDVISMILLFCLSFCTGVAFSTLIAFSIKKMIAPQSSMLVSIIFASMGGGIFILSILLEPDSDANIGPMLRTENTDQNNSFLLFSYLTMNIHSRYPPTMTFLISAAFQACSVYPIYMIWKNSTEENSDSSVYDSIVEPDEHQKKALKLCAIIGFLSYSLLYCFPYFIFSNNDDTKLTTICFTVFSACFALGRIVFTATCRQSDKNAVLSLSLVMCGISVCIYSFDHAKIVASATYGLGLSMIHPALVVFIGAISHAYVYTIISAFTLGPVIYLPFLTYFLKTFGSHIFASVNFLTIIIAVLFFVCLLNVQSKMAKPEGQHSATVWRFFRGEGALKRTRSLRKFIGSIRGSIRGKRYRRIQRTGSPNDITPSPSSQMRDLPANRLSPSMYTSKYRSKQSGTKVKIEIEDDASSSATVSLSLPPNSN